MTTTNNPWTDSGADGMGEPPPGVGTRNSRYTDPTSPAVPGLQLDGYWPDGCNAYRSEPVLTNKDGQPWIPGCTPPPTSGQTCFFACHHDAQFVIRIPDDWDGHLVTAGTPANHDEFSSDFIFADFVLEKGWAYIVQDKGNMGDNFYHDGTDEIGSCGTPWCPVAAISEWTARMRQATTAARALLNAIATSYGLRRVTRSYAIGVSIGGYQVRRALETDTPEYTGYTCSNLDGHGTPCVSTTPTVPATDPDAAYNYSARLRALPALARRMRSVATTGDIQDPLITLQGDQDALRPIKTDSDIYARLVLAHGHSDSFRYYPVAGGNHIEPLFDAHFGVDRYGTTVLRPMLPCVRAAIDAMAGWVENGSPPPPSHTIARPQGATAEQLANDCSLHPWSRNG